MASGKWRAASVLIAAVAISSAAGDAAPMRKASIDRNGGLRLYREGDETLAVSAAAGDVSDGARTVVSSYKNIASRRTYDAQGRLLRCDVWDVTARKKVKDTVYTYADGNKPTNVVIRTDTNETQQYYDGSGRLTEERQWQIVESTAATDAAGGDVPSEDAAATDAAGTDDIGNIQAQAALEDETSGEADEAAGEASAVKVERHLLKVVRKRYTGDDGDAAEVVTATRGEDGKKRVVREVFEGDDIYRYENGALTMSEVHTSEDDYIVTVIFGDGEEQTQIVTEYKDGKRISTRVIK